MRALLRDAQDQTRIALEVEEAVYDPKDNKLLQTVRIQAVLYCCHNCERGKIQRKY